MTRFARFLSTRLAPLIAALVLFPPVANADAADNQQDDGSRNEATATEAEATSGDTVVDTPEATPQAATVEGVGEGAGAEREGAQRAGEDAEPDDSAPASEAAGEADNPGQALLDRALEVKISASTLNHLNEVIDLLDSALDEGLEADNSEFAEQMLVATLLQRGTLRAAKVLSKPIADPRRDPGWLIERYNALLDLQRSVSLDGSQTEGWLLIGRLQSMAFGDKSEARRALTKVIRLAERAAEDPSLEGVEPNKLAQAYALRGAAQKEDGDRLADFNRAIELSPEKPEFLLLRAKAHQAAKRPEECLVDIDRALELDPENAGAFELKALALIMQERPEDALKSFDRASELAPNLLSPYQYRGVLYNQLGKPDEAIDQLNKALDLAPNNLALLLIRSELLMAADQPEKALADIDKALRISPGKVQAHLMKARALDGLGRGDEAVAWLERVAQAAPDQVEVQLQLAAYYVDRGVAPQAIEALTRVVDLDPNNELAHRLRGDMYLLIGKHAEALADFEAALVQSPDDSGVLNNFAWTLATSPFDALRNGERAVELAERACELTEYAMPHILSTLAAAHAEAGDFDQAIRWSQESIDKAEEIGSRDAFDGQLEAELDSYRSGQPWRELQQKDAEPGESEEAPPQEPAEFEPANEQPQPVEPAPSRSFDF